LRRRLSGDRMNAAWHRKHPMPQRPSREQRIRWHIAHAKACSCREMPPSILMELRKRRRKRFV
jgi:hypothetical protein